MWEAEEAQPHFPLLYCLCSANRRGTGVLLRAQSLSGRPFPSPLLRGMETPSVWTATSKGKGSVKEVAVTPRADGVSLVREGATPNAGAAPHHTPALETALSPAEEPRGAVLAAAL